MDFFTADICDNAPSNVKVLPPIFNSYGKKQKFFGEIETVKLYEDNKALVELLRDTQGNGRVCVVDVEGNYCAVVGENLMNFAAKNGWAGIVINGYVRDTLQTSQIDVGLFAIGTYPFKSQKKQAGEVGIDLNIHNIKVTKGEFLWADVDGVVITKNQEI